MKTRPKVYVTRQIPQAAIDVLLRSCNISQWNSNEAVPRGELRNNVQNVDCLLCMSSDKIDKDILNCAGNSLKVVANMSEDTDNIDVAECKTRGIKIVTLPQVSSNSVVDLAVELLKKASRRWLTDTDNKVWCPSETNSPKVENMCTEEISKSTVGIVGYGRVGKAVGDRIKNMGIARIMYSDLGRVSSENDSVIQYASFDDVVRESDILCVCYKVSTTNAHLFNKETFQKMKKRAILINLAKGDVINYHDLYYALKHEDITAAGLEVREKDEVPFKQVLVGLPNCFFHPFKECNPWDARRYLSVTLVTNMIDNLQN
ncbi:hypothetical protein ScPMuIL_008345 [Solemya velum]